MTKFNIDDFKKSLHTGFIDKSSNSDLTYQPELLVNRKIPRTKVLTSIISELEKCESFFISVAFVTTGGVASLMNSLILAEEKGIQGKIIVSQYLNFTQPEALKKLLKFKNIELRIATKENSHSKGYIFRTTDYYNLVIGSSNLTDTALSRNKEWNLKVTALHSSDIVNKVISEFEADFKNGVPVTTKFIAEYSEIYNKQKILNIQNSVVTTTKEITPNSMQIEALENLIKLRLEKKEKALLISATGTGKTYLSAFDAKKVNPKRLLFVVHRRNIAEKALETFQTIFGNSKKMGLFSGERKEINKDFLFCTVQTISKESNLELFKKDCFDYIIIDESHRSGASSYLRLLEYFKPKFLLGMTATPERTDGNDIFSLFNHNIAYEIRLNRAMEEEMLSPFHYFGVTDLTVNGEVLEDESDFNKLIADERINKIIENAELYGSDNGITRGLIFCSRKKEAIELSEKFNERKLKTVALTGNSSEEERKIAIERLESDNLNDKLDYIFTVDIFNEGIDIPKINQIIMLRPTNSSIIFIQQLGRGLRKTNGKSFVTIIDFIGNYTNNYLIPIALYGDTTYNKDSLRKLLSEGSRMIPGTSTINFDAISKQRIFDSISSNNLRKLADLRKDYDLLKYRLGRTPMMMDFINNESRDPSLFVEYSKSYYNFVKRVDVDFKNSMDKKSSDLIGLFNREINNAQRVEESYILKELIINENLSIADLRENVLKKYNYHISDDTIHSCLVNINFEFIRKNENIIYLDNESFYFYPEFTKQLNQPIFKSFLLDSIDYSIYTFDKTYQEDLYRDGLILYKKYSRKDVCRVLNWDKDVSSTVYGYRTNKNITPCFVTYHKSDDIEDTIKYNDYFVDRSTFAWESRSNRKIGSNEIKGVINSDRILLFIKKKDGEGTDFYFMGDVSIIPDSIEQSHMPVSNLPVVHFKFLLDSPVVDNIYTYITSGNKLELEKEITTISEETEIPSDAIEKETPIFKIPLYDFYAAAGSFSEMQSEKNYSLIETEQEFDNDDYFACEVIGESMNRRIQSGSICLFKKYKGGSRNGKIVLVENFDHQDPDFHSSFTVKTYSSQKNISEEGWSHSSIILSPNSYDSSFKNIIIDESNGSEMRVIGEFVKVLNEPETLF